jgi:hypothetical protein
VVAATAGPGSPADIYDLVLSGCGVGRYKVVTRIGGNISTNDISTPGYFGLR